MTTPQKEPINTALAMNTIQNARSHGTPETQTEKIHAAAEAANGSYGESSGPLEKEINGIPRRSQLQAMAPAELAIRNAMLAVESIGGSPGLTEAINLLQKARDKVADFLEGAE